MATINSASITNLDATPVVQNTTGEGAPGYYKNASDYVTPTTGQLGSTATIMKMVRLPSNAKLKALKLTAAAALDSSTGLVLDVGAYYSDATADGTSSANQGALISANCFSAANAGFKSSALGPVDALNSYSVVKRNQPLWKGLGLSSDPGGFIDIAVAVNTIATTAVSSALGAEVAYVE